MAKSEKKSTKPKTAKAEAEATPAKKTVKVTSAKVSKKEQEGGQAVKPSLQTQILSIAQRNGVNPPAGGVERIDSLTPEQEALFPHYVAEYTKIGMSTDRIDFDAAAIAVRNIYKICELTEPEVVLKAESPLGALATLSAYDCGLRGEELTKVVDDAVNYRKLPTNVANAMSDNRMNYRGGSLWADWYAFVQFFVDIGLNFENKDKFLADKEVAMNSSWIYYGEKCAVVSDRPTALNITDGRLHCADGPSIAWADGLKSWHLNGVEVDEQIVMKPETQTTKQIQEEQNEEKKRIRIERFAGMGTDLVEGWRKYIKEVGAKEVDSNANDIENTKEKLLVTSTGQTLLICACPSTARVYSLEVPATVKKCEDAQKWLWNGSGAAKLVKGISIIGRS